MRALVYLTILCISLHYVSALNCYLCSGGGNSYCNDPPNLSYIKPESCGLEEVCLKISSDYHVERKCGKRSICSSGINNDFKTCETCETDLCNSASGNLINVYLAVLLASFGLGRSINACM